MFDLFGLAHKWKSFWHTVGIVLMVLGVVMVFVFIAYCCEVATTIIPNTPVPELPNRVT